MVMEDFDKFEAEKLEQAIDLIDKFIHVIAPDVYNPEKDYEYVKFEIINELLCTGESILADAGFSICYPSREWETETPCYLSEARCEHCPYTDKDGRTKITERVNSESEEEPLKDTDFHLDENGKPILTVIKGGQDEGFQNR